MNRGRSRLCVLTHVVLTLIAGLAIPVREIRVLLFAFQGDHQTPQQQYPEEVAVEVAIPMLTSMAAMESRLILKCLNINLMVRGDSAGLHGTIIQARRRGADSIRYPATSCSLPIVTGQMNHIVSLSARINLIYRLIILIISLE
jgi:hypothetical protein